MFEVPVPFANNMVYGNKQHHTRMFRTECFEWLEEHAGDWGVVNMMQIQGGIPVKVGRIFQFENNRIAILFYLKFQQHHERQRSVKDAS